MGATLVRRLGPLMAHSVHSKTEPTGDPLAVAAPAAPGARPTAQASLVQRLLLLCLLQEPARHVGRFRVYCYLELLSLSFGRTSTPLQCTSWQSRPS